MKLSQLKVLIDTELLNGDKEVQAKCNGPINTGDEVDIIGFRVVPTGGGKDKALLDL